MTKPVLSARFDTQSPRDLLRRKSFLKLRKHRFAQFDISNKFELWSQPFGSQSIRGDAPISISLWDFFVVLPVAPDLAVGW
jgi:hypothetical protein